MATTAKKQTSIIPDIPRDSQVIDPKTGRMTAHWELYHQQLNLSLQSNYQNEGVKSPPQTTSNINTIVATNQTNLVGNLIYDTTLNHLFLIRVKTLIPYELEKVQIS